MLTRFYVYNVAYNPLSYNPLYSIMYSVQEWM